MQRICLSSGAGTAPWLSRSSAGAGFRFSLFGFAIAELNLVHPFDGPEKDWVWEFNLQPGY